MFPDPFRWLRRRERLHRHAHEEAEHLRRRHGEGALDAAREKARRPDLTHWGKQIMSEAIRELKRRR
jgi:hypothetical protein